MSKRETLHRIKQYTEDQPQRDATLGNRPRYIIPKGNIILIRTNIIPCGKDITHSLLTTFIWETW